MIYISVCCLPDRIANEHICRKFLFGLLNQKSKLDYQIILNIPKYFINYKSYEIPSWFFTYLKDYPNIILLRDDNDYGPISNIIHPLKHINFKKNDILLVCDDDHLYSPYMIDYHFKKLIEYPDNHSICFRGNQPMELRTWYDNGKKFGKFYQSSVLFPTKKDLYLKLPDHWHSVSYWVKNLNLEYLMSPDFLNMTWNNDLLMGYYGWDNNMFFACCSYECETDYRPVNYDGRGSNSFPIDEMLPFESNSGCNLFRAKDTSDIWDNQKFCSVINKDKGIIEL
jgi:hypothetical protein